MGSHLFMPLCCSFIVIIIVIIFFLNWSFGSVVLQSGCCKPPTACGYGYVNPTLWLNPANPAADPDCLLWNNDQTLLCYNCDSCKAGLLGNLRREWRKTNVILIVAVVVLIWVYLIACSAFKNAQTEDLFRRYKQGWVWSCYCLVTLVVLVGFGSPAIWYPNC